MPSNVRTITARASGAKRRISPGALLGLMLAVALVVASAAGAAQGPPANTFPPTISGSATSGTTLYASAGTWESPGAVETTIQWQRCVSPTSCAPVLGATSETYLVSDADAGAALRIEVAATNHWATAIDYSEQTAVVPLPTPPKAPPVNTVLPEVTGVVEVGATLVTTSGSWTGSTPMSFEYEWRRCDTSGGGCLVIPEATSSSYVPAAGDLGLTLRSTVTATNADGSATAVSEKTAEVAAAPNSPPVNTGLPVVSGGVQVGATLTTSDGSWTGSTPMSFAYEWRRCDTSGGGCLVIPEATSSSYVPTTRDTGLTLRSTVTATNADGSATAVSLQTGEVAPASTSPPMNIGLPAVNGVPQVGATLTTSNGSWTGSTPMSFAYEWRRCDTSGGGCLVIPEATSSSYVPAARDFGLTLRSTVTATNADGSATAVSEKTAEVAAAPSSPPVNAVLPVVSGFVQVGATLTTTTGSWTGSTPMSFAYEWRRCDTSGGGCLVIPEATSSSYVPAAGDFGLTLRSTVTATNADGSATAVSEKTAEVAAAPSSLPVNTVLPVVSGVVQVGATLTTSNGSWTGSTPLSYAYQWRKCDTSGGGCLQIPGATSSSYVPTSADLGLTLRSTVMASNAAGSSTAVSLQTAEVGASALTARTTAIPGIGIHRLGATWGSASGYERYAYVVVGRSAVPSAVSLPGKSLVYHSGTSVNVNFDTGVPYTVASANDWLLRDASGNYLKNLAYPDNYIGDVGSSAYQAEWARRVGDYLASVGADGVHIDDVIANIVAMSGTYPAKYPDQASWENAMASFVATVGSSLKARGFYVVVSAHKWVAGNSGSDDGSLEAQWWQRLAPSVSGLFSEYWVQDPTNVGRLRASGGDWWNNWDGWQRLVAVAQAAGVDFFAFMYGSSTDTRTMRYGKASFLLDWNGGGGAFIYHTTDGSDPWNSAWTTDMGRPLAAKTSVAYGVWLRRFERGTVVVNATGSTVTVTVDGVARTIAPTDALILTA